MPDAVVIGGGIAGSALAIRLAVQGWNTVLIDRQQFPRHKPCGEFLSPEAQVMLSSLGVHDLMESAQPSLMNQARLVFRHGGILKASLPGTAWGISRYVMDSSLQDAAEKAGVDVRIGTSVISLSSDQNGYVLETKRGIERETIRARTVFAAWGSHRRPELIPYSGKRLSGYSYIGVKTHMTGLAQEHAVELYFVQGGYIGIAPVEDGVHNVAGLLRRDGIKGTGLHLQELLESAANGNPKLAQRLLKGSPVQGTQVSTSPVYLSRKVQPWRMIPHVGDACAMIPPLFGDGMCGALRSALLCASFADKYLRGNLSLQGWEKEYTEAVHREFSPILRKGYILQSLSSLPAAGRILSGCAQIFPAVADSLVRGTRLKNMHL